MVRRIIALDVGELSLVDHPAIERQFLVTKRADVAKAVWSTAKINDLPDSSFLYIAPGGKKDGEGKTTPRDLRHLPVKDENGKVDLPHLRNALARAPQADIPASARDAAISHAQGLLAHAKKETAKAVEAEIAKCAEAGALTGTVKESIKAVVPWLQKMSDEASGAGQVALLLSAELLEKIHGGAMGTATKTEEEKRKDMEAEERMKAEKAAAEKAAKAKPSGANTETEPGGSGTEDLPDKGQKVARTKAVAEPMMMFMSDGRIEPVTKAGRKYLTGGRMSAVSEAAEKMLRLMKESDVDAYKALISRVDGEPVDPMAEGEQPDLARDPTVPASEVRPTGIRGSQTYGEKGLEGLAAMVTKAIEPLVARVEKIEKARAPSGALPDGGTDSPGGSTTEVDVKKAFWGGVL